MADTDHTRTIKNILWAILLIGIVVLLLIGVKNVVHQQQCQRHSSTLEAGC